MYKRISNYLFSLAFMLLAVLPVTESIDWLYYTLVGLFILSITTSVILSVRMVSKDKSALMKLMDRRSEVYNIMIGLAGLIVSYATDGAFKVWVFYLALLIVGMLANRTSVK